MDGCKIKAAVRTLNYNLLEINIWKQRQTINKNYN